VQEDEFLDVIVPDQDGHDIVLKVDKLNAQEESKELSKSKRYLTARFSSLKKNNAGTQQSIADMDDEEFFDAVDEL